MTTPDIRFDFSIICLSFCVSCASVNTSIIFSFVSHCCRSNHSQRSSKTSDSASNSGREKDRSQIQRILHQVGLNPGDYVFSPTPGDQSPPTFTPHHPSAFSSYSPRESVSSHSNTLQPQSKSLINTSRSSTYVQQPAPPTPQQQSSGGPPPPTTNQPPPSSQLPSFLNFASPSQGQNPPPPPPPPTSQAPSFLNYPPSSQGQNQPPPPPPPLTSQPPSFLNYPPPSQGQNPPPPPTSQPPSFPNYPPSSQGQNQPPPSLISQAPSFLNYPPSSQGQNQPPPGQDRSEMFSHSFSPRRTPPPPPPHLTNHFSNHSTDSGLSAEHYLRQINSQDVPPVKVVKPSTQNVVYRKEIRIRYLQPPTPAPPAPIIIREKHEPQAPPQSVNFLLFSIFILLSDHLF